MFVEYLHGLKNIKKISLMAYHRGGREKYKRLRKEKFMKAFESPSDERIEEIKKILTGSGFSVKKGG